MHVIALREGACYLLVGRWVSNTSLIQALTEGRAE